MPLALTLIFGGLVLLYMGMSGHSLPEIISGHAQQVPQGTSSAMPVADVAASGSYTNPLGQASGVVPERVDMGQDFSASPGSPIVAIGDSKVLGIAQNWYSGQPYVGLQLLNGPYAGQNYYVAEQIAPAVQPGQIVKAGQPIGYYAAHGTGIEMGWAGPNWQQTLAQATGNTGGADHSNSPAGQSFANFLKGLGL